jgi:hypothetical protein
VTMREILRTVLSWMPGYLAHEDANLGSYWHLKCSAKGRNRGTMVYDFNYGLRVRIDDPELVKELKTLVLINNLEDEVSIYLIERNGIK